MFGCYFGTTRLVGLRCPLCVAQARGALYIESNVPRKPPGRKGAEVRKLWSNDSMLLAVEKVKNGFGLREAARQYNVPVETA